MPWYQNPITFCQGILSHWASFLLARSTYSYPLMPFNANLDNQNQCPWVLKKFRSLNKKRDFFLTCFLENGASITLFSFIKNFKHLSSFVFFLGVAALRFCQMVTDVIVQLDGGASIVFDLLGEFPHLQHLQLFAPFQNWQHKGSCYDCLWNQKFLQ